MVFATDMATGTLDSDSDNDNGNATAETAETATQNRSIYVCYVNHEKTLPRAFDAPEEQKNFAANFTTKDHVHRYYDAWSDVEPQIVKVVTNNNNGESSSSITTTTTTTTHYYDAFAMIVARETHGVPKEVLCRCKYLKSFTLRDSVIRRLDDDLFFGCSVLLYVLFRGCVVTEHISEQLFHNLSSGCCAFYESKPHTNKNGVTRYHRDFCFSNDALCSDNIYIAYKGWHDTVGQAIGTRNHLAFQ